MINVAQEVIDEYLTDSTNKELIITRPGLDEYNINYYVGDITKSNRANPVMTAAAGNTGFNIEANISPWTSNFAGYIHEPVIDDWDYFRVRFTAFLTSIDGNAQSRTNLVAGIQYYYDSNNPNLYRYYYTTYNRNPYNYGEYWIRVPRAEYETYIKGAWKILVYLTCLDGSTVSAGDKIYFTNHSVAFYYTKEDFNRTLAWESCPSFSNLTSDEISYTIDNDNLIYEDFSLTESLCSQDNIKFGLCEAAHCEFSEVGKNVTVGDKITVKSRLKDYPHSAITSDEITEINWSSYPPTAQSSTHKGNANLQKIITIIDDNKTYVDLNPYYDDYFNDRYIGVQFELNISDLTYTASERPAYVKLWVKLLGRNGSHKWYESRIYCPISNFENGNYGTINGVFATHPAEGDMIAVLEIGLGFNKADMSTFADGETITANIQYRYIQYNSVATPWTGSGTCPIPTFDPTMSLVYYGTLDAYLESHSNDIPLGVLNVTSVENEYKHNLVRKKITAYDNLVKLENNAADWYTQYMFGIDFDSWTSNGFKFARQIFSTYWNFITSVGLDSDDRYSDTLVCSYGYTDLRDRYMTNEVVSWTSSRSARLMYGCIAVEPDPSKLYKVVVNNYSDFDPANVPDMLDNFDSLGRGATNNGDVLIEFHTPNRWYGVICNSGDYFMPPDNCTNILVYIPVEWEMIYASTWQINSIIHDVSIYKTLEDKPSLANGHERICYYNYGTKEIFKCDSSITGRDVVRSLLEVCGCFFRLDRYNGLPEFVYPTKGGLYPSNTLYPADDLYPRAGTDTVYPMGRYLSIIAENYEVKDYGRIQILKKIKSSDTQSVVEWQYEGDPNLENTYIIDDNIFYCAEEMEYDYDGMPEVANMLAGMYNRIANLGYTPNVTQALGAPWLECGDRVGLLTFDGGVESFVFRRTLKGIQNLKDTYESEGDELNPAINNFGY